MLSQVRPQDKAPRRGQCLWVVCGSPIWLSGRRTGRCCTRSLVSRSDPPSITWHLAQAFPGTWLGFGILVLPQERELIGLSLRAGERGKVPDALCHLQVPRAAETDPRSWSEARRGAGPGEVGGGGAAPPGVRARKPHARPSISSPASSPARPHCDCGSVAEDARGARPISVVSRAARCRHWLSGRRKSACGCHGRREVPPPARPQDGADRPLRRYRWPAGGATRGKTRRERLLSPFLPPSLGAAWPRTLGAPLLGDSLLGFSTSLSFFLV